MPAKRRILVAFEEDLVVSDASQAQKRQRKIAVSIDSSATNADLAKEIAATLHRPNGVILEVAGGFELRDQDGIEMIGDNDIVTARLVDVNPTPLPPIYNTLPPNPAEKPTRASDGVLDAVDRFKIVFVTAEHAVTHAKQTPKDRTEPTNGVLAFEGEPISGATTLRALEREAARALQWTSPNAMEVDEDDGCVEEDAACSCHIGQEIERHGLSSTLHCRFTLDGSSCSDGECPYSHVALDSNIVGAPHCSICTDALAFPCPPCLARAENRGEEPASVRFCPLVENAGCGHLHHAHCVGPRSASTSCPSGCAVARFPREAVDFQNIKPHLVLAWDGVKIDRIPIPFPMDGVSRVEATTIVSTDAVVMLVEIFFQDHNFVRSDLLLRVHSRDAVTESVKLVGSTFVSVCPSSSHLNQAHRRFALFPTHNFSPPRSRRSGPFSVDLHTSHAPIIAYGDTQIRHLFPSTNDAIVLYVVKRTVGDTTPAVPDKGTKVSKQSMYLADPAWQPHVPQTTRGIAALLSSLYLFAHAVSQTGGTGEERVLAQAYSVLRFPPAIRTLAALLLNKVPQPEEKAALSAALFHAVGEFSWRGPAAITTRETRRFETVRILLAYIASAAKEDSQVLCKSPVEEISLVCTLSRKRLRDPVLVNSTLVERTVAHLNQPSGPLYHPTHSAPLPPVTEMSATDVVRQLLPRLTGLPSLSTLLLRVEDIAAAPPTMMAPLDGVARDFVSAIKRANLGDLVTQGPLELKSVDVIPPRIVIDQEGLLGVFTGRGCGTTRDVNFFRPTHGGDTEVDINDVSHALQKVIETRKAEDTWQVDCFGEVSAISRPPDEAIVLCLDLSESMNRASSVQKSGHQAPDATPAFDAKIETNKAVAELVTNMRYEEITSKAKAHLESQHPSCHHPWATLIDEPQGAANLLDQLSVLASRDLLRFVFSLEDHGDKPQDPLVRASMVQLACFVFAAANATLRGQLQSLLIRLTTDSAAKLSVGEEPYDIPQKFLDFRTGELLVDPVHPDNAPARVFVNRGTEVWYRHWPWPLGHCVSANMAGPQLKKAVMAWVAGADVVPKFTKKSKAPSISLTLQHRNETTTWKLSPDTTTRTVYALANRATRGMYSEFTLRSSASHLIIADRTDLTLSGTDLVDDSILEMLGCEPHTRQMCAIEVTVGEGRSPQRLVVPKDASLLIVLSYIDSANLGFPSLRITKIRLWHGLKQSGDGVYRGHPVDTDGDLADRILLSSLPSLKLECRFTGGVALQGARAVREESKTLTRLHLLKELFHVFLNRVSSFDTTVSLVLGLVTFSDKALVTQELTPIFENFRQSLDRATASGDTAVYDALDSARRVLTGYRPDLPNLKKRIIIVSDGEDTSPAGSARDVCLALQRARVVVDSVQVGHNSDPILHAISVATGGYRFAPKTSLADALSIFDLETVLHSGDRPPRARMPFVMSQHQLAAYENQYMYPVDLITVDKFPPRAEHPLLKKPVKSAANSVGFVGAADDRTRRIMREIKNIVADAHPNIDVYFNDQDMSFLKVILEAPKDLPSCPYVGGTFLLTVNLPAGYPRDPPEVRFVTFILHPNISKQGKVCIAELGRLWSSDITLKEIFSLVYGTLLEPDLENPLEIQASLKYYEDDGTYALAVADAIAVHASKTRAQWREELGE